MNIDLTERRFINFDLANMFLLLQSNWRYPVESEGKPNELFSNKKNQLICYFCSITQCLIHLNMKCDFKIFVRDNNKFYVENQYSILLLVCFIDQISLF